MAKDILYPLRRLHGFLNDKIYDAKEKTLLKNLYAQKIRDFLQSGKPFVFLVMTPEHGNLGDHAIASAEAEILKRIGISYIEISSKQMNRLYHYKLTGIMNGFPILITGGGNIGTLWMDVETLQREIIRCNPKSKISILPNTAFYEDSEWGKEEFEKTKKIFKSHKDLYLYAREKISFELMNSAYKNVKLIPDMVFSLNKCEAEKERRGCLLCFRGDKERTRTEEQEQIIRKQAEELFGKEVRNTDMVTEPVPIEKREKALADKYGEFSEAELVITDRLHGMIFCAITGTPCVVVNSKSPKVKGCYEWIKNTDYIRFADDVSKIAEEYRKIPKTGHRYDNSHLIHYYEELAEDILNRS